MLLLHFFLYLIVQKISLDDKLERPLFKQPQPPLKVVWVASSMLSELSLWDLSFNLMYVTESNHDVHFPVVWSMKMSEL